MDLQDLRESPSGRSIHARDPHLGIIWNPPTDGNIFDAAQETLMRARRRGQKLRGLELNGTYCEKSPGYICAPNRTYDIVSILQL